MRRLPEPIPQTIKELFEVLVSYAENRALGVVSLLDRKTGETRFVLYGERPDKLVPLGFLSNTTADEVIGPGEYAVEEYVLRPELYEQFLAFGSVDPEDVGRWEDDGGVRA